MLAQDEFLNGEIIASCLTWKDISVYGKIIDDPSEQPKWYQNP